LRGYAYGLRWHLWVFFLCSIVSEQLWQLSISLADIRSRLLKIIQKKGKKS
jgi:hypothetical protein